MEEGEHTEKRFGSARSVCSVFAVGNSWLEQPIFFVDFEGSRMSGILEFGVVEVHHGKVVSVRTRLCRAVGRIRAEDAAVHGLREETLATHAPFTEEWNYFSSVRELGPLAAHYAGVENGLLKSVWPYPHSVPDFARPGGRIADWGPWVDTARLYAQLFPTFDSGRLESLVTASGVQGELDTLAETHCPADRRRYHAALYDALAGALLLTALAHQPQLASLSMMQLLALSTLDGEKRDALQQTELF
jgi:DNA polymerase III epsilon subunit-like protein